MAIRTLPKYESKYPNFHLIMGVEEIRRFVETMLRRIEDGELYMLAVDTETYYNPNIEGIVKWIYDSPNNCPFGVSFSDGKEGWWVTGTPEELRELSPLLEHDIPKTLHNAKYDIQMLLNIGITLGGKIYDTVQMIHNINEEFRCKMPSGKLSKSKKLKDLAYHFLGESAHELEDAVDEYRRILASNMGKSKNEISYLMVQDANIELMTDYACADTLYTFQLCNKFKDEIRRQQLEEVMEIDTKAMWAIIDVERTGMKIDRQYFEQLNKDMLYDEAATLNKLYEIAGYVFNANSDAEVVIAFNKKGVVWRWITDKDNYKTDKSVLKTIIRENEGSDVAKMAELLLEYRTIDKYRGTYVEAMLRYATKDDRIHCDFNLCPRDDGKGATVTGRLSSSNPNLHNIPKKDLKIRRGFVPSDGYILVFFDYAQQEYRVLAHYSKDPNLIQFIKDGKDIHTATAALLFNVPYDEVTKEQRSTAKTLNFGLIYGLGNPAFANALGQKIDEDLYKAGWWAIMNLGYKPWDMPQLEEVEKKFNNSPDTLAAVRYVYSDEAQSAIAYAKERKEEYFDRFPTVLSFLDSVKSAAKNRGYIKYWTGRKRHFADPMKDSYKAPNSLIQGGCGDIMHKVIYGA